jgi:hypothetical protein
LDSSDGGALGYAERTEKPHDSVTLHVPTSRLPAKRAAGVAVAPI